MRLRPSPRTRRRRRRASPQWWPPSPLRCTCARFIGLDAERGRRMLRERIPSIEKLVEPDRVHRLCYVDPDLFELELSNIFEKTWVYAGHESQVPKPGDYSTFDIGRQPMVMLRDASGRISVFHNRSAHRGAKLS